MIPSFFVSLRTSRFTPHHKKGGINSNISIVSNNKEQEQLNKEESHFSEILNSQEFDTYTLIESQFYCISMMITEVLKQRKL